MLLAVNLQVDNCVWFASMQQKTRPQQALRSSNLAQVVPPGKVMQMPGMKMPMPGDDGYQHRH